MAEHTPLMRFVPEKGNMRWISSTSSEFGYVRQDDAAKLEEENAKLRAALEKCVGEMQRVHVHLPYTSLHSNAEFFAALREAKELLGKQ